MKNFKKVVFGLLAMLVMVTGVNAATPAEICDGKVAYVVDEEGTHCFSSLKNALYGVKKQQEEGSASIKVVGNEIVLIDDAEWSNTGSNGYVDLDFVVTINLNGHNIKVTSTATKGLDILANGNVTINGTGKIDLSAAAAGLVTPLVTVEKDGAFATMGNVTIDYTGTKTTKNAFVVEGGSLGISKDTVVKNAPDTAVVVNGAESVVVLDGTWNNVKGDAVIINNTATDAQVEVYGTWTVGNVGVDVRVNPNLTLNATMTSGSSIVKLGTAATEGKIVVEGGKYTAKADAALDATAGIVEWTINSGDITAKAGNVVTINGGTLTFGKDAGTYISDTKSPIVVGGANPVTLTINGGTFTAKAVGNRALVLSNTLSDTVYAINGGTFNSAKDSKGEQLPAIYFASLSESFLSNHKGMLTGGRYLNSIITDPVLIGVSTYKSAEDVLAVLVKEGYEVTEDGSYKVITKIGDKAEEQKPADEQQPADTPSSGANDGEETNTNENTNTNPSTFDGIASIVTMAVSSLGAAGYSIKKIIRK